MMKIRERFPSPVKAPDVMFEISFQERSNEFRLVRLRYCRLISPVKASPVMIVKLFHDRSSSYNIGRLLKAPGAMFDMLQSPRNKLRNDGGPANMSAVMLTKLFPRRLSWKRDVRFLNGALLKTPEGTFDIWLYDRSRYFNPSNPASCSDVTLLRRFPDRYIPTREERLLKALGAMLDMLLYCK
eukprot:763181-Hanusia_phi.AAC.2